MAVQFEPIQLSPAHAGMMALRMRELGYPRIEQHPPLQPVIEQFGTSRGIGSVVLELGPPIIRHWFVTEDGRRLVQLQPDRLIHNWRKTGSDDEYPRYEGIRDTFAERFREFGEFVSEEGLGELRPNQAEVTYVNHIVMDAKQLDGTRLAQVMGIAGSNYTDGFLPPAEDTRVVARYVINDENLPIGRLHINAHTAIDLEHAEPLVVVNLTARGAPSTADIDGVLKFMDLGREWVVRGFADATTAVMHEKWERTR